MTTWRPNCTPIAHSLEYRAARWSCSRASELPTQAPCYGKGCAAGKRRLTEIEWADEYEQPSDWSENDELMPDEYEQCDTGWRAGPISRGLPQVSFTGPTPGPTNSALNAQSGEEEIMGELLTPALKSSGEQRRYRM